MVEVTLEDDGAAGMNFIAAVIVHNYQAFPPVAEDAQINIKLLIIMRWPALGLTSPGAHSAHRCSQGGGSLC